MSMDFLKLKLDELVPDLPPLVTDETQKWYADQVDRLHTVFGKLDPSTSNVFEERRREILQAGDDDRRIAAVVRRPAYILPLISLWKDGNVGRRPTPALLDHIEDLCVTYQNSRLGLLQLRELLALFFSRYDELAHLDALGKLLRGHLARYKDRKLLFGLDKFKKHAEALLNAKGHERLAALTENSGKNLAEIAEAHGIPTLNSRFFEAALTAYYVSRLERLKPNEADTVLLYEVQDNDVYGKRLDRNNRLGHAVLRILIDILRDAGQTPSDLWRSTLLAIGGDPRVAPTMRSYRDWWMPLDKRYTQQMIEWLSELDLNLFLQLFEELAKEDRAMKRMFPARQRFLRGLLDKKLIRGTRLFLSGRAADFVRRNWQAKERPVFVPLAGGPPGFVAFYLNLGTAHMVEGTHSFALRIMDEIPSQSPILSFDRSVSHGHLTDLDTRYQQEFGGTGRVLRVVHHPDWQPNTWRGNSWQEKAVNHLRNKLGIDVLLSDVT